jgi:hypothetical protein
MEEPHLMTTDPYAGAPGLGVETAALDKLRAYLAEHGTDTGPAYREYLLRHAAHLDRLHQADPAWVAGEDEALNAALFLTDYDRYHGTWLGGLGPDSNTWTDEDGALDYVRNEWRHWAQQNTS